MERKNELLFLLCLHFRLKASRAMKLLKKRATTKEEKISAAMAAGVDWESDDSETDVPVKMNFSLELQSLLVRNAKIKN